MPFNIMNMTMDATQQQPIVQSLGSSQSTNFNFGQAAQQPAPYDSNIFITGVKSVLAPIGKATNTINSTVEKAKGAFGLVGLGGSPAQIPNMPQMNNQPVQLPQTQNSTQNYMEYMKRRGLI